MILAPRAGVKWVRTHTLHRERLPLAEPMRRRFFVNDTHCRLEAIVPLTPSRILELQKRITPEEEADTHTNDLHAAL
jgi:hypothetical protein